MDKLQQQGVATFNGIAERLLTALETLDAPYVPSEAERRHLETALSHLIAAFDSRDFEPGEEAVWNCGTITIAGQHRGAWEIRVRQTDAIAMETGTAIDSEAGVVAKP